MPPYNTNYPTTVPDYTDLPDYVDDVDDVEVKVVNDPKKELIAALVELGTLPKGVYASVKDRLDHLLELSGGTLTGTLTSLTMVPTVDNASSLGDATHRYKNLRLSDYVRTLGIKDADGDTYIEVDDGSDTDEIWAIAKNNIGFGIYESGIISFNNQSKIRAHRLTTDQTIVKETYDKVEFNEENYDQQGEYDKVTTFRFVATKAGYYLVAANIRYTSSEDQKQYWIYIYKNAAFVANRAVNASGVGSLALSLNDIIYMAANDWIEIWTYHNSVANKDIQAGSSSTWFAVHKLS